MNGTHDPRKHLIAAASMAALLAVAGCGERQETPSQAAVGEQQAERQVSSALEQSGSVPASDVDVASNDEEVTLSGEVPDDRARSRAGELAMAQPRVNSVDNELEVQGSAEGTDASTMGAGPAADSSPADVESGSFTDPLPRADRG